MEKYDFAGWATKNDLKCSDGRVIRKDAFKHNDGKTVPLVWNHQHNEPFNVLGHACLENREEGVYVYGFFNDTEAGKYAKSQVKHGDISSLSIWAGGLTEQSKNVLHGDIREVSLVIAGANPGAFIDSVMVHGEESIGEAIVYTGEGLSFFHAEEPPKKDKPEQSETPPKKDKPESKETLQDIFDTLTEKQQTAVYAMLGQTIEDPEEDPGKGPEKDPEDDDFEGGNKTMKHNAFNQEADTEKNEFLHAAAQAIFADVKRYGSLKDSALAHGIENIDFLFPEAKSITNIPEFVKRDTGWVQKVMAAVHHTPFARIKTVFADITEEDARAKGYIKGKLKKDEVFSLLKRTTSPTTVYKKQKMDRDDMVDITDFDVVAWLKFEMRMMLDEELARAFLIGDGRLSSSDDKIKEDCIRPVMSDDDFYTIKAVVDVTADATDDKKAREFIRAAIKARKDYKGSGQPTLYVTEDVLTDCLLIEDTTGRTIYEDENQLSKKLRVKEIVTVPVMEGVKGKSGGDLMGLIVNLADYNVGADKGGAVNMFDDFDIDYNAQKYLIETRCSGALVKPYAAIALEAKPVVSG